MTKKELETMLPRLLDELKAQRMHYEKIVRAQKRRLNKQERLLAETEPKPELRDLPENPFEEATEEEPKLSPLEHLRRDVELHTKKRKGKAPTPCFTEFVKHHDIDNLEDIDEYLFTALLKRDLGDAVAQSYTDRTLPRHAFRCIVRFYDESVDEGELNIPDELRAAAEAARKEAEEAALRLRPTSGEFRLRGRTELERFFNENVVDIVNNHAVYRELGIDFPKPFILEGAPGCGKTFAVERLAEHLGWHIVRVGSDTIGSTYVHGTAKKIEESFAEACEHAPALVVIDEMDAFMPNRATMSNEHAHTKEEVGCFLKAIQRAAEKHVLVVGMTNLIESIDPAILRTGRMGTHIKVDMPSLAEVEDVLAYALDKRPHEDFPLTRYAEQLLNRPLSDVTYAADEAAMHAARARRPRITEADLTAAIRRLEAHTAPKDERRPMGFAA